MCRINELLLEHKEASLGVPGSSDPPAASVCWEQCGDVGRAVGGDLLLPGVLGELLAPSRALLHAAAPSVAKQFRHSLFSRSVSPSPCSSGDRNTF